MLVGYLWLACLQSQLAVPHSEMEEGLTFTKIIVKTYTAMISGHVPSTCILPNS